MNVWAIVPVFDEAATVGEVVQAVRRHLPVLVIDDGSRDSSAARAGAAGADVIRHPRRLGKGQALLTGVAAARQRGASHVVTLDGDGQHAAADLPRLLAAAHEAPGAIVVGTRLDAHGRATGLPPGRLNAIRVAGFFVNWVSGLALRDTQSGFRVYPLAALGRLSPRHGGFVLETEVLVAAAACGVPVREVPVTVIARASRRSHFRPIADGVAIGAFLTARALARWGAELRAAAREVGGVVSRERRQARHAALLEAGVRGSATVQGWGAAVLSELARRMATQLAAWWHHPRCRRAAVAARASLAAPLVLVVAIIQGIGGRFLPDLVTPLVDRLYAQARLAGPASATPERTRRHEPATTGPTAPRP